MYKFFISRVGNEFFYPPRVTVCRRVLFLGTINMGLSICGSVVLIVRRNCFLAGTLLQMQHFVKVEAAKMPKLVFGYNSATLLLQVVRFTSDKAQNVPRCAMLIGVVLNTVFLLYREDRQLGGSRASLDDDEENDDFDDIH